MDNHKPGDLRAHVSPELDALIKKYGTDGPGLLIRRLAGHLIDRGFAPNDDLVTEAIALAQMIDSGLQAQVFPVEG